MKVKNMVSKDWWQEFLDVGPGEKIEERRRLLILYFSSYIGGAIILFFGIQHVGTDNVLLLWILLISGCIILVNVVASHYFTNKEVFYYIAGVCVSIMLIGLIVSGGYKNTALYWVYPFPMVLFVILGYRIGIVTNFLIFILITFLLTTDSLITANYPPESKSRFLASLGVTIFLTFIGEYFRHKSYMEMKHLHQVKNRQANMDPLTQLPNRRFLNSIYFNRISHDTTMFFPLTIVAFDIDHFKTVNDTYGHNAGDEVLKEVSLLIKNNIRNTDLIVRMGGEEFSIFFSKTDLSLGLQLTEKLRKILEQAVIQSEGEELNVTASFGVACALTDEDVHTSLKLADENLYKAKQNGRNCIV